MIDGVVDGAVGVGNGGTQTTVVEPLSVLSIITITQALIHNSWPVNVFVTAMHPSRK